MTGIGNASCTQPTAETEVKEKCFEVKITKEVSVYASQILEWTDTLGRTCKRGHLPDILSDDGRQICESIKSEDAELGVHIEAWRESLFSLKGVTAATLDKAVSLSEECEGKLFDDFVTARTVVIREMMVFISQDGNISDAALNEIKARLKVRTYLIDVYLQFVTLR